MIYNKKEDPTASTINTEEYMDELRHHVEDRQIMKILDLEIKQAMMESELYFNSRIDTITEKEMQQLIDNEIRHVERLIYQKTSWNMGMCIMEDKEQYA